MQNVCVYVVSIFFMKTEHKNVTREVMHFLSIFGILMLSVINCKMKMYVKIKLGVKILLKIL
jgi:hypothetical protein